MICDDCGKGFRCDAYDVRSGDRCYGEAIENVALDMNGWNIVQVQLCREHIASYRRAGSPHKFVPTPEQIAEAQRIADERAPAMRVAQQIHDASRSEGYR